MGLFLAIIYGNGENFNPWTPGPCTVLNEQKSCQKKGSSALLTYSPASRSYFSLITLFIYFFSECCATSVEKNIPEPLSMKAAPPEAPPFILCY